MLTLIAWFRRIGAHDIPFNSNSAIYGGGLYNVTPRVLNVHRRWKSVWITTRSVTAHVNITAKANGLLLPAASGLIIKGPDQVLTEAWKSMTSNRLPPEP